MKKVFVLEKAHLTLDYSFLNFMENCIFIQGKQNKDEIKKSSFCKNFGLSLV